MPEFTDAEIEVMRILWEAERPLKPAEIQESHGRPIRNAALRSVLLVLLDKGHVARAKKGKAYFYRAVAKKEDTFRRMARRMAELFHGGDSAALIAGLVESEGLSSSDIEALKELAGVEPVREKPGKAVGPKGFGA